MLPRRRRPLTNRWRTRPRSSTCGGPNADPARPPRRLPADRRGARTSSNPAQAWLFGYLRALDDNFPDSRDFPAQGLTDLLVEGDQLVRARATASLRRQGAATATDALQRALSDVAPRV